MKIKKKAAAPRKPLVTKDMLIADVIQKYPGTAEVFTKYGIHCAGCHFSSAETIEQGLAGHRMELGTIIEELNAAAAAKREKSPPPAPGGAEHDGHGHGPGEGHATNAPLRYPLPESMKGIRHKVVVMSGKGGVGKSTVAANLAYALAKRGSTVGLIDCDITGPTIPKLFGLDNVRLMAEEGSIVPATVPPGIKVVSMGFLLGEMDTPVIWRGPLKMSIIRQFLTETVWGDLDYLIVDLPPGTSDEPLSVAQSIPDADGAVVVTTPQEVALQSVRKSIKFTQALGMPILGIIENMSGFTCPHCGKSVDIFGSGGGQAAAARYGVPLLGRIPLDPEVERSGERGIPLQTEKGAASPAVAAFEKVVDALVQAVEKKQAGQPILTGKP